jgi:hypothetical protein
MMHLSAAGSSQMDTRRPWWRTPREVMLYATRSIPETTNAHIYTSPEDIVVTSTHSSMAAGSF